MMVERDGRQARRCEAVQDLRAADAGHPDQSVNAAVQEDGGGSAVEAAGEMRVEEDIPAGGLDLLGNAVQQVDGDLVPGVLDRPGADTDRVGAAAAQRARMGIGGEMKLGGGLPDA